MDLATTESRVEGAVVDLLSTGQAAKILGSSRQHVVDLCSAGDLPYVVVGTHRRVSRRDVEALAGGTRRMTRDQRRSLWLGHAIAGKLVAEPEWVIETARRNIELQREVHRRGQPARAMERWAALLNGPIEELADVLVSRAPEASDLRQNSPFAGVLTERERSTVLAAFEQRSRLTH